jgi:5-methylcytosine-specific restriction endonuclease McrA
MKICPKCQKIVKKRTAKICGECYRNRFEDPAARQNMSVKKIAYTAAKSFDEVSLPTKKTRVLLEQNGLCLTCGQGGIWKGRPLVLQLDHIDGDNQNHARSNLRALCPNCHTQTPTWGFGKCK